MTTRRDLPTELPATFSVGEALDAGVSPHRLDAADLRRPFHGTRVAASAPQTLDTRCRALATRFRAGDAFTGPTAALLWGMPLPSRDAASPTLFVSSQPPVTPMRRAAVAGSLRFSGDPVRLRGISIMPIWETCRALALMLSVPDLTAVIDFVLTGDRGRNPLSTLVDLDAFLLSAARFRGISPLRRARQQARRGAWSRPETLLRLVVLDSGIPEPELNLPLAHPSGRQLIPDLAWPAYGVAAEYNGIHHDVPEQRVHDLRRIDDFTDIGWMTVNVERTELFRHPDSAVARVARRLTERGWVPSGRLHSAKSASWPHR